ncbi:MAG: penicillin-binding protein activator LpoB [Spirochaetaceae bacterium]|jgi:uncharacterized protein (TIGR02722 family)|nr:penicillin-binding protein activator LpoB [Spirochaetaceae bacterium]
MINVKQICIAGAAAVLLLSGCVSTPTVTRVDADTVTDLSGYWNDTDVRIVANSLIEDCLASPQLFNFSRDTGRLPVVIVGTFRNESDEHIDTSILTKRMEAALVNSGKVDFVASSSERGEIRSEREEQQLWASEETAKRLANETGADFMMLGSVKTMIDQVGNTAVRTYMVYAELINVETNRKIWIGENREIKKVIERSSYRP